MCARVIHLFCGPLFQTSSLRKYLLELTESDNFLLHKKVSTYEIFKLEIILTATTDKQ